MVRTPNAVFSTVGHIEHMAMVKSPAGSGFLKSTSPSGSHARGETGRRIWMMGSKLLKNTFDMPRTNPSGVPIRMARLYPLATRTSEYHVNRRIPWSSSPRFSNGARMYGLLISQVFCGDGRLVAQETLE